MKRFEDLSVFNRAIELMLAVYQVTESFPVHERYGLVAQMRRASISVISHVSEGQGRLSLGEWRQFLSEARGSLYEVQGQAIAAQHLGYLDAALFEAVRSAVRRVAAPLAGLIRYVLRREREKKRTTRQPDHPTTR